MLGTLFFASCLRAACKDQQKKSRYFHTTSHQSAQIHLLNPFFPWFPPVLVFGSPELQFYFQPYHNQTRLQSRSAPSSGRPVE